jgi:hypothetical protein
MLKHNPLSLALLNGAHTLDPLTKDTINVETLREYLKTSKIYTDRAYMQIIEDNPADNPDVLYLAHLLREQIMDEITDGCPPMWYIKDMLFCLSLHKTMGQSYAEDVALHFSHLITDYSSNND